MRSLRHCFSIFLEDGNAAQRNTFKKKERVNIMEEKRNQRAKVECKHNKGVECEPRCAKCHKCGWNPDVDKERRENNGGKNK